MSDTEILSKDDLTRQRGAIFRGLALINSVNLWAVALVAVLGFISILLAFRSKEDAERLWAASVTQARASRFGGEVGWRSNALATISRASELRPSLALRNEAIAAISTMDLDFVGNWQHQRNDQNLISFSPDLKIAAVSSLNSGIELLDTRSGRILQQFKIDAYIEAIGFSSDGSYLAGLNSKRQFRVWSVATGSPVVSVEQEQTVKAKGAFAFAKEFVLIAGPGSHIEKFSVLDGTKKGEFSTGLEPGNFFTNAKGDHLACISGEDLEIWNLDSGKLQGSLKCPGGVGTVAFSASGRYLTAGNASYDIYLWDLAHNERKILSGHRGTVFRIVFSPDEKRIASCAFGGTTRVWETSSGRTLLATESVFIDRFGSEAGTSGKNFGQWRVA